LIVFKIIVTISLPPKLRVADHFCSIRLKIFFQVLILFHFYITLRRWSRKDIRQLAWRPNHSTASVCSMSRVCTLARQRPRRYRHALAFKVVDLCFIYVRQRYYDRTQANLYGGFVMILQRLI